MKKVKLVKFLAVLIVAISVLGMADVVKADPPYGSDWGKLYRAPEYSNENGRIWYSVYSNKNVITYGEIYLECYYNCGSSTSITHKYVDDKGRTLSRKVADSDPTRGYSSCTYTVPNLGKFKSLTIYGAARGISVSKTYT